MNMQDCINNFLEPFELNRTLLVYGRPNRLRFMSEQIYSQMRCFIVGSVHKTLKANTIS